MASLSVEGVSKSSIARALGLSWNTVARWLDRASRAARQFNNREVRGFELIELQADEIHAFSRRGSSPAWVFASIEVWSRSWVSTVVGMRSYQNARTLLQDTLRRSVFDRPILITTDGFAYYAGIVKKLFGPLCILGQVIKTWRKKRVRSMDTKVDTKIVIGDTEQVRDALLQSEDSHRLNTSFIERLNLTIRQGSAYLCRRSLAHARSPDLLDDHLELLRCHYDFIRPHRALKFGREVRTPAMQAGLANKRLAFRRIFSTPVTAPSFVPHLVAVSGRPAPCRGLTIAA